MSPFTLTTLFSLPLGVYVLAVFGLFYALMRLDERRQDKQEKRRGYRILWLSSGQLRGNENEWAMEYREKGNSLYFYGKEARQGANTLNIPSAEHWDESVAEWARGRRKAILQCVRAEQRTGHFVIREI